MSAASAAAHHAVCVLSEPLQCEQRVVWLNDHVTHLILVWKDRISLHQLLWVPGDRNMYRFLAVQSSFLLEKTVFQQVACVFVDLSLSFSSR